MGGRDTLFKVAQQFVSELLLYDDEVVASPCIVSALKLTNLLQPALQSEDMFAGIVNVVEGLQTDTFLQVIAKRQRTVCYDF